MSSWTWALALRRAILFHLTSSPCLDSFHSLAKVAGSEGGLSAPPCAVPGSACHLFGSCCYFLGRRPPPADFRTANKAQVEWIPLSVVRLQLQCTLYQKKQLLGWGERGVGVGGWGGKHCCARTFRLLFPSVSVFTFARMSFAIWIPHTRCVASACHFPHITCQLPLA